MNVTKITVSAGRCFNHPYEQYSNLQPRVEMTADLNGESPDEAVKELQAKAEKLVEDHKQNLLNQIQQLQELGQLAREATDLERTLKRGQERLEELRKTRPEIFAQPLLAASNGDDDDRMF